MKKIHIALLVVACITAVASVYSLAAINQVYSIDFQWYSTYKKAYLDEIRDLTRDKWQLEGEEANLQIGVTSSGRIDSGILERIDKEAIDIDFGNYFLIWATTGEESSPEYNVRVSSIAQRGEVVEVVLSLNSPSKVWDKEKELTTSYYPFDLVKINKSSLATRGKMLFIFKDQSGIQLFKEYMYI